MKKTHFGAMLLIIGSVAVLAFSLYVAISGRSYFFEALLDSGLMGVFVVFALMGVAGLVICLKELYPLKWEDSTDRMENIKESVKSMAEDIGNKIR